MVIILLNPFTNSTWCMNFVYLKAKSLTGYIASKIFKNNLLLEFCRSNYINQHFAFLNHLLQMFLVFISPSADDNGLNPMLFT